MKESRHKMKIKEYKKILESYYEKKIDNKEIEKSFKGFIEIQEKLNKQKEWKKINNIK